MTRVFVAKIGKDCALNLVPVGSDLVAQAAAVGMIG